MEIFVSGVVLHQNQISPLLTPLILKHLASDIIAHALSVVLCDTFKPPLIVKSTPSAF